MDVTDFTNNDDLFVLLSNLQNIFKEFKNHEEIENEFIMRRLNLKLKVNILGDLSINIYSSKVVIFFNCN